MCSLLYRYVAVIWLSRRICSWNLSKKGLVRNTARM
jgi:hypothetical protein